MKEIDYCISQDLTRLRMAWTILMDIITIPKERQQNILKAINFEIEEHRKHLGPLTENEEDIKRWKKIRNET